MNILTVLDPIEGLKESNESLKELTIDKLIYFLRKGRPISTSDVVTLTDNEGRQMTYTDALNAIPSDLHSKGLRKVLNATTIIGSNERANVYGQRVVR